MKTKSKNKFVAPRAAFTLLEILIAISIVVIIGGVRGASTYRYTAEGRRDAATMQLGTFKTAIQIYVAENGFPPSQRQGPRRLLQADHTAHPANSGQTDTSIQTVPRPVGRRLRVPYPRIGRRTFRESSATEPMAMKRRGLRRDLFPPLRNRSTGGDYLYHYTIALL